MGSNMVWTSFSGSRWLCLYSREERGLMIADGGALG